MAGEKRGASGRRPPWGRLFLLGAGALGLLAALQELRWRLADPLPGAWWIGQAAAARMGQPAEVAFVKTFHLAAPAASLALDVEADRGYELLVDGRPLANGAGPSRETKALPGPFPAGSHTVVVFVKHPTGVASLRLRLLPAGEKKKGVVTDSSWRVDDAERIRDRGPGEARYTAAVWGRPPLSSWGLSSPSRS